MNTRSLICILFLILGISWYFMSPLCEDIYVFLGAAHLAEIQYGGGLTGAVHSWELKLIANRVLIFLFYKVTTLFVSFDQKTAFEFSFKLFYLILVLGASFSLSSSLFRHAKKWMFEFREWEIFSISTFLLLFTSLHNHLQAEYSALLICLIGLPFLLSEKIWKNGIGLLLLASTPFFKGISALFALEIFILLNLLFQVSLKKTMALAITWGMLSFGLTILLFVFYPAEFSELKNATLFQQSFSGNGIGHQLWMGIKYSMYNLVFFPGLGIALLGPISLLFYRQVPREKISLILVLWGLGIAGVFIQHRFYVYHYLFLFLPVIITLLLFVNAFRKSPTPSLKWIFRVSILLPLVAFVIMNSPLQKLIPAGIESAAAFPNYVSEWSYRDMESAREKYQLATEMAKEIMRVENESVLYLDEGTGIWCLGKKSASRYYFPIPVQRSNRNPDLLTSKCYQTTLSDIVNFRGSYIHLDKTWFKPDEIPGMEILKEKLKAYDEIKVTDQVSLFVRK